MTLNLNQTLAWKKSLQAKDPSAAAELAMLNDLQGNILKGHGRHHTSNLFITFDRNRQAEARHFLASVGHDVTTALDQLTGAEAHRKSGLDAGTFVGVMLSAKGYGALGCDSTPGDSAFAAGMANRSLNDPPASDWDSTLKDVHAMILVATSDGPWRDSERAAMIARIAATKGAVNLEGHIDGNAIFNGDGRGIEHFGYVDGRSQPLPLQEDVDHEAANGGITIWDPAIPLSQVLVQDPGGQLEVSFGSYFVFRKLEQNVKGFKQREDELADHLDQDAAGNGGSHESVGERAGASVVGRFENGTPVTLDRDEVPLAAKSDDAVRNNFDYRDDQDGLRCPYAGHIRKSNPRADTGKDSIDSKTHLMARRGIPYGSRTDGPNDGRIDDKPTGGVGLLFMAYQADLEAQFEFTQSAWVNNPAFARPLVKPGPETGIDPVIGQSGGGGSAGQLYPVEWNQSLSKRPFDFSGFVTMRGGEYFFAPSISFLKSLQDPARSTTSVADLMDRLRSAGSTDSARVDEELAGSTQR